MKPGPSWRYLTLWYATSLALLLVLAAWKFGSPLWLVPRNQLLPLGCLAAAFVLSASAAVLRPALRDWGVRRLVVFTIAVFGLVFLGLIVTKSDFSRAITLTVFASSLVLVPAPFLVGDSRLRRSAAIGAMLAVTVAGAFASRFVEQVDLQETANVALRPLIDNLLPEHSSALIKTEFYNLDVESYARAFPKSAVHGGALAPIGDRYLLLTGDGHLYVFAWEAATGHLSIKTLPQRVPINGDAFSAAAGRAWADHDDYLPQEAQRVEAGHEVFNAEWFRTYGLLVQEVGPNARIFVSYDHWNVAQECWTERVSMLEADRAAILRGEEAGPGWRTLYETAPCLPVRGEQRRHGIPFAGYFGGGRMALLDPETLLLTVGDFGFDGVASAHAYSQDPAASYGKTIAINIASGRATIFTLGHRNPQGLCIDQSGTIWSTEHGPQGGDELNRIVQGANYGWPYATFGTDYGSFSWPLNKPEAEQEGYRAPVFAWVPSIGISNLVAVEHQLFSQWRGDLLIATLKEMTLFRARVREGEVKYVEPIVIGSRIRDLIEGHDGSVILWTDDSTLISLRPKEATTGEALFAEKCSGCHQATLLSGNRIGPNLVGVVGRQVASIESYPDYSPSLRRLGGVWTEDRLDRFLEAPSTFDPGTNMDFTGDASAGERQAIVSYLRTLR